MESASLAANVLPPVLKEAARDGTGPPAARWLDNLYSSETEHRVSWRETAAVWCRIEIPKGSRNKYEWDERLGGIKFDRLLFSSVAYPTDYGFIPDTIADDGDALDAIVCVSAPTFPGCVIRAEPIALFRTRDEGKLDDKVVCVPCEDPGWSHIEALEAVPMQLRNEIEHFFSIYKEPERHSVEVEGWRPRQVALDTIDGARRRWREAV